MARNPKCCYVWINCKNIDTQEVLFTKYNIYASGYQLDNSEVNLSQNLKWQVRGLDENKVPVSDYTKPRLLHKGKCINSIGKTRVMNIN